jgi:hypothetical protein
MARLGLLLQRLSRHKGVSFRLPRCRFPPRGVPKVTSRARDRGNRCTGRDIAGCGGVADVAALQVSGHRNRPSAVTRSDAITRPTNRPTRRTLMSMLHVPSETATLLHAIEHVITRYVILPETHAAVATTLWVLHTHAIDAAHATPYLVASSPDKQSGKDPAARDPGAAGRPPVARQPLHVGDALSEDRASLPDVAARRGRHDLHARR